MSNQDQFSEEMQAHEPATVTEFSTTRRVVTVVLVLVAAGLLGYVLYINLMVSDPAVVPDTGVLIEPISTTTVYHLLSNPNRSVNDENSSVSLEDLSNLLKVDQSTTTEEVDQQRMLELLQ
jgi:hypothetical protein